MRLIPRPARTDFTLSPRRRGLCGAGCAKSRSSGWKRDRHRLLRNSGEFPVLVPS
jgi:hypothetical protein